MIDKTLLPRAVVAVAALVYWGGVMVQARRIRKRIGHSPNLRPRTPKEKILWLGWMLVIVAWIVQPIVLREPPAPWSLAVGIILTLAGYAATLWCYVIMGNAWRIGINREEKNQLVTTGPYRAIRHPIYAFQIVMLLGALLLLPTVVSGVIIAVHFLCVLAKASDEETYLTSIHGQSYRDYLTRTGRLFPKLFR